VKKIIIGIGALVLIGSAFFAGKLFTDNATTNEATQSATNSELVSEAQYFEMERFIISVSDKNYARYLVLDLVLVLEPNVDSKLEVKKITPLLRNVLVKQFANMSHANVKTLFTDIDSVQKTLLEQFNLALKSKTFLKLDDVLVTNVFIQ